MGIAWYAAISVLRSNLIRPHQEKIIVVTKLFQIDQLSVEKRGMNTSMKITEKQAQAVRCPTCGAKPGEKCELTTGLPRTESHRDRRLTASDKKPAR
jgi:hypothetical protein